MAARRGQVSGRAVPSLSLSRWHCVQSWVGPILFKTMRPVGKVGASVLSLVLLATPIMACVMPAGVMTAAERDCCKRMAQECGKGMTKSHSCCQTMTAPDLLTAIKSSSSDVSSKPLGLVPVNALPPIPTVATMPISGSSPWATDIHSPPVSPPVTVPVLRI